MRRRYHAPSVSLLPEPGTSSDAAVWQVLPADSDEPCGFLRFTRSSRRCRIEVDANRRGERLATQSLAAWMPAQLAEGPLHAVVADGPAKRLATRLGFEPVAGGDTWRADSATRTEQLRASWSDDYRRRARELLQALSIEVDYPDRRGLPLYQEASELTGMPLDPYGRTPWLTPDAARAWLRMQADAASDGVPLTMISAFRSYGYQLGLVRRKRAAGQSFADIFSVTAPPGYSEHHTGKAIDIGHDKDEPLTEAFEATKSFEWLSIHAANYGFFMSYPRDNPLGMLYEPWHWRFRE